MKELQVNKRKGEEDEEEGLGRMKRRWGEVGEGVPDIKLAIEELSQVKPEEKKVSTMAFLCVSNLLLQVIDKIGPTMAVLRRDVQSNIERLERCYISNPSVYYDLVEIMKKEVEEGTARKGESSSRAIVWLTRSLDFSVAFVEGLENDPESSLEQLVEESYTITLKPSHGWISSAAYKVALKLLPDRKTFINLVLGHGQESNTLKGDIQTLVSLLQPLLNEIHALLRGFRLDKLKSA
uniref:Pleckstrin y domain-containing family A member 8 n=1 Tax=Anthurium amnicola TaxID=1678845 RepID=A0A1D1YXN5_9ARAE